MTEATGLEVTAARLDCLRAVHNGDVTCHVTDRGGVWFSDRRLGVARLHVRALRDAGLVKVTGGRRVRLTRAGREALRDAEADAMWSHTGGVDP